MPDERVVTPFWVRVVADERFRDALIEDPLRALAATPDVTVDTDQLRELDEMERDRRAEVIAEVVREVHLRGAVARFGQIGDDGRLGGGSPG